MVSIYTIKYQKNGPSNYRNPWKGPGTVKMAILGARAKYWSRDVNRQCYAWRPKGQWWRKYAVPSSARSSSSACTAITAPSTRQILATPSTTFGGGAQFLPGQTHFWNLRTAQVRWQNHKATPSQASRWVQWQDLYMHNLNAAFADVNQIRSGKGWDTASQRSL